MRRCKGSIVEVRTRSEDGKEDVLVIVAGVMMKVVTDVGEWLG